MSKLIEIPETEPEDPEEEIDVVPDKEPEPVLVKKTQKEKAEMPDTGDKQQIFSWILAALASSTLTVLCYKRKRNHK